MQFYKANASVIYTDNEGRRVDTFVVFDTDLQTGLTHINHENLQVRLDRLEPHAKTVCDYHLPIDDAFSFEMINKLREKYAAIDAEKSGAIIKEPEMHLLINTAAA